MTGQKRRQREKQGADENGSIDNDSNEGKTEIRRSGRRRVKVRRLSSSSNVEFADVASISGLDESSQKTLEDVVLAVLTECDGITLLQNREFCKRVQSRLSQQLSKDEFRSIAQVKYAMTTMCERGMLQRKDVEDKDPRGRTIVRQIIVLPQLQLTNVLLGQFLETLRTNQESSRISFQAGRPEEKTEEDDAVAVSIGEDAFSIAGEDEEAMSDYMSSDSQPTSKARDKTSTTHSKNQARHDAPFDASLFSNTGIPRKRNKQK